MANPTLLTSPIAENGDKNVIPASTGATTGLLDQEHGFQQINELPLQAGGLPPQRKDFNGVFNLLSGILYMTQRGYTFEWDATLPYVAGCIVRDTDGKLYRCINDVPAGGTQPSLDSTNWVINDFSAYLPLSGGTLADGNITIDKANGTGKITITSGTSWYTGGRIELIGINNAAIVNDDTNVVEMSAPYPGGQSDLWIFGLSKSGKVTLRNSVDAINRNLSDGAVVSKSLNADGYIKYNSGFTIQWGSQTCYTNGTAVTFPLSFDNACLTCIAQAIPSSGTQYTIGQSNKSKTGITLHPSTNALCTYIAIGY